MCINKKGVLMFRSNSRIKFVPLKYFGHTARKQPNFSIFRYSIDKKHSLYPNGLRGIAVVPISFSNATNVSYDCYNIEGVSRRCLKGVAYYATKRLK